MPHGAGKPTKFEIALAKLKIKHKLIRPYTPRHNGKVERSHRKDNEYFYATHRFYSFLDFKNQLVIHNRRYNAFPLRPLGWVSPKDYLSSFYQSVTIFDKPTYCQFQIKDYPALFKRVFCFNSFY
jgi:hypothetical protein